MVRKVLPPYCAQCGIELTNPDNFDNTLKAETKKLEQLNLVLSSEGHNNVALIGKAGTGKTALIKALGMAITSGKFRKLCDRRLVEVKIDTLLKDEYNIAAQGSKLANLLTEAENERIILFIDEGHRLYGNGEANSLGNMIKPYLTRDKLQVIIATTIDEYSRFIERDNALRRRFTTVENKEPNEQETFDILSHVAEKKYPGVSVAPAVLKMIVTLGTRYILAGNNPDKTLGLLDASVAWEYDKVGQNVLTPECVINALALRIGVSEQSLVINLAKGLANLSKELFDKFPGWEKAVNGIKLSARKALTRKLRNSGPLSLTVLYGQDARLLRDMAVSSAAALGCVGDNAVFEVDVNRTDASDPYTSNIRKNPNAAFIFSGISLSSPAVAFQRLREIAHNGVLKDSQNRIANYDSSHVFFLCDALPDKRAMGFGNNTSKPDGDTETLLAMLGVPIKNAVNISKPDKAKLEVIYDRIFLPLLKDSAERVGLPDELELTEKAKNRIFELLASERAWSRMYSSVEDIIEKSFDTGVQGTVFVDYNGTFEVEQPREDLPIAI